MNDLISFAMKYLIKHEIDFRDTLHGIEFEVRNEYNKKMTYFLLYKEKDYVVIESPNKKVVVRNEYDFTREVYNARFVI